MVDIQYYIQTLIQSLQSHFGARLMYVGLQGSYLRGEATANSDIDIMVVLDELSVSDLEDYRRIVRSLDHAEKSCGFICGKSDLVNWNPLEMWSLVNGTKDYYGTLRDLIPPYTEEDVRNHLKMSLNNLYHEICHRYIHAEYHTDMAALAGTYKSVFFILQELYYLQSGIYVATKAALLKALDGKNRAVLERCMELNKGTDGDFADSFELLFMWCRETAKHL